MGGIRSLARGAAKERMKKKGYVKFCKHDYAGSDWQRTRIGSVFSKHWRKEVG